MPPGEKAASGPENVQSPIDVIDTAMNSLKVYSETLDRLEGVDLDLQFGVLDDTLPRVEAEIDKRTRYSQQIAEHYFGADAEGAIADMTFVDFLKVARRMKRGDVALLLGEARDVSGVVSKFFQTARRRTIGRLEKHGNELDEVETTAIVASRVSDAIDEPQALGRYAQPEDPAGVLKAAKVLNGATKNVYPGETDFDIMHELLGVSGALVLGHAARYLHIGARLKLAEAMFKHKCDPTAIKDIFDKGKNWHIYMQSLRAPKTLVDLLKEHQTAYNDIAAAKEQAAAMTGRVTALHGLLREVASHGVARHMERAIGALDELLQDETAAPRVSGDQVQYLFSRLRYVDDEDTMINLGMRLEQLLVAA